MRQRTTKPLYKKIKDDIVTQIAGADLSPGDALPLRSEMAVRYRTTRATVDRAIQELMRDGIVTGGSGRRTFVCSPTAKTANSLAVVWSAYEVDDYVGDDFFGLLFAGIRRACAEAMLEVHFRESPLSAFEEVLAETQAQGLLVLRPDYSDIPLLERLSGKDISIVAVPGILEAEHIPSISSDNFAGMQQAIDHLVSLGHTDIALASFTTTIPDHFERLQGFLQAMGRHGLSVRPHRLALAHATGTSDFARLAREWLDPHDLPTAIVISDFLMALNVFRVLSDLRIRVPKDVSLLSFDDPPAASHITPAMTVIKQFTADLGYRGVQRLIQLIQGEDVPLVDRVSTGLVVRESTAAPRR